MSGPQRRERLSAISLPKLAKAPGAYNDGKGLVLRVRGPGAASWLYRYMIKRKAYVVGLGPYPDVSLKLARERVTEFRELKALGRNPATERKRDVATTFAAVTHAFIDAKSAGWSIGQVRQWQSSLRKHAAALNDLPVSAIDVPAVLDVLKPIWLSRPETARRVRQRIELIMAYGEAHGYRGGNNPAGKPILNLLPVQKREITHFADMPLAELSGFMKTLTAVDSPVARALEFTILTAARASMVFGADWSEFDLTSKVWTIPRRATPDARGMKAGRLHQVPLSDAASACLGPQGSGLVFGGISDRSMLALLRRLGRGETVHGFRSTFSSWARTSGFHRDEVEGSLAHKIALNATEEAYLRTSFLDRRRQLMRAWADVCAGKVVTSGNVVGLRA